MPRIDAHPHDIRRRGALWPLLLAGLTLAACTGTLSGDDQAAPSGANGSNADTGYGDSGAVTSSALRRLSVRELENTFQSTVGFVPEAIDRIPPDSLGHSFDRVV